MIINLKKIFCLVAVLLITALSGNAYAQKSIAGKVTDENNEPVIGASVVIVGTTTGTSTGIDGTFKINAKEGATLSVSYVGYVSKEIKVGSATNYNVKIEPDKKVIEEVVVIGYGSQKKSDLTGSVSSVQAKDIEGYKSASVIEALGGQIAGVQITQMDGTPGAGFDVKIRGVGTLTGDASPLYVVDGFQVDNIDYLASSDIASIDILKDASASAIYGARAANGVVLITTKSGKPGRVTINYNGSASYRSIYKTLDMLSPYEFVKLQMELNPSKYATTYYDPSTDDDGNYIYKYRFLDDYIGVKGVDWQKETFKPTWSQDHNISVSGGTESTTYTASYSNYSENGIFTNSSFQKNTAKLRLNQKVTKDVKFDFNLTYSRSVKKGTGTSADGGRFNMLAQILSARPTGGLKITDDQLLHDAIDPLELEEGGSSLAQVNPIVQAQSVMNNRYTDQWVANAGVTVEIIKGLSLRVSGNYNLANNINDLFYRIGSKEAFRKGNEPYGNKAMSRNLRWGTSNYLTYKFNKAKHSFDAMIGQEASGSNNEGMKAAAERFFTDQFNTDNMGIGAVPLHPSSYKEKKLLLSYFTRFNYSYKDRYMFTATMRADGSSVFSDDNKWGYFPAFSAAWRISEEDFMKKQNVISNLKLRLGYGMVGNDGISNFLDLPLYEVNKYGLGQSVISVLNTKALANPKVKWEASETTNVGIDISLFRNRLSITVDGFVKNTKDLLLMKSLPYVTGFDAQIQNIGKIQNKGLEINISSTNIHTKEFRWTTDFNISFIRNTLKALQPGENHILSRSGFDSDFTSYDYIAMVGSSIGLMYGFKYDGVYQESDFYRDASTGAYVLKPGVPDISAYSGDDKPLAPGFVKYKDIDGDGVISDKDRTVIGNGTPKWYGGITNSMFYKNFDLSFMFQFNYGNDVYNATRLYATQSRGERKNMRAEVGNRWTPENANNIPSAKGYIRGDVYSRFVEDGSFLRLKNITIGYTLPQKWTKKVLINKARVYVSGQNLFVVSKYKGYDPEVSMRASNPMMPSLDWGAYPRSRVFTFGLDVQF